MDPRALSRWGRLVFLVALACGIDGAPPAWSGPRVAGDARPAATGGASTAGATRAATADTAGLWSELARLEVAREWARSESLGTVLAGRLEAARPVDSLALSRALLYVANGRIKRRIYADGIGFGALERAIAIRDRIAPRGDRLTIWARVTAATMYSEAGAPDRAVAHGEAAIREIESSAPLDSAQFGQAHLALGTAFSALGSFSRARDHFEAALRVIEAMVGPENPYLVPTIAEIGAFYTRNGEFDAAHDLLVRAVRLSERGDSLHADYLEGSLARLSTLEDRIGNVGESLELAERLYDLARRRWGAASVPAVRAKTVIAYRLDEIGDETACAALLRQVVPAMTEGLGADHPQTVNARLVLVGALVALGDTLDAATQVDSARASLARNPQLANSNAGFVRQLAGDLERARGRFGAAGDTLEAAIEIEWARHDPIGDDLAVLHTHLLECLRGPSDRARLDRATRGIERLRDSTRAVESGTWAPLVAARARAEARVGRRDSAWVCALEAERLARAWLRNQLHALPDRRALQLAQQAGSPCDLLVAIMRPDRADEVAVAWDRFVRWRGLVRHEIERRRPPAAAVADSALASRHREWVVAQHRLAQLVVSGAALPDDPESARRYEAARSEAELAEQRFVQAASGRVAAEDPIALDLVLRRLEPGQALAAFAIGSDGSGAPILGAFVANGRDRVPRWVALGPAAAVEAEVRAWTSRLGVPPANGRDAARREKECRGLGFRVRSRVWDPVVEAAGNPRDLFLVPEGPVSGLPWLALPGPGRGYVAESAVVVHSIDAERDLLAPSADRRAGGLLAIGAPDYDRDEASSDGAETTTARAARRWTCAGNAEALPPLPAARAEVEEIARRWPAAQGDVETLLGAHADERAFKRDATGRSVIHIATHGVVVEDTCLTAAPAGTRGVGGVEAVASPSARAGERADHAVAAAPPPEAPGWLGRRVWLALAGANRPPGATPDENEGLLTSEEVVTLDLRGTDWVVLSACHSGIAKSWSREGVLGMQRAFHLAGARAVIASAWAVGDESTREWMAALYSARAEGAMAGPAVERACREVLAARRASSRSTLPFYWAAFAASGD